MLKAIETRYQGYRFRSRLEARWAVFFDALGVQWEYEKEGFDLGKAGWYLPDFWLPEHSIFVEVKGEFGDGSFTAQTEALQEQSGKIVVVLIGSIPPSRDMLWAGWDGTQIPVKKDWQTLQSTWSHDHLSWPLDWGALMVCPLCGDEHVHMKAPEYAVSDEYSAWSGRGSAIRIPCYCEAGCEFALRFGFHKGNTFIAIEGGSSWCDDFLLWLSGFDVERVETALRAARAARFEHGESG